MRYDDISIVLCVMGICSDWGLGGVVLAFSVAFAIVVFMRIGQTLLKVSEENNARVDPITCLHVLRVSSECDCNWCVAHIRQTYNASLVSGSGVFSRSDWRGCGNGDV